MNPLALLRAPLSGNVQQAVHDEFLHLVGGQYGLVNVQNTATGDPQAEKQITTQVASYGRQLGWIVDALEVLIEDRGRDKNDPALKQITTLYDRVAVEKQRIARERTDSIVAAINALKADPVRNQKELDQVRAALGDS